MASRWLTPVHWRLRTRSALAAALVVGIGLLLAAAALVSVLYRSLELGAIGAAQSRADQIAAQLRSEPAAGLDLPLLATDGQVGAVQLVDPAGRVLTASNGAPRTPLVSVSLVRGETRSFGRRTPDDDAFDYFVVGQGAAGRDGAITVLVGADREPIETVVYRVIALLAVGSPVIVLLVVVGTSRLVGAALRPVETMRRRVAAISGSDLSGRVPVPAARDEVALLAETMNEMLERAEAAQLAQRRFVSDASHELRSPITTISAALDLAGTRPDGTIAARTLIPEVHRLRLLVDDLLLLARADERAGRLRRVDVDLDDLVFAERRRLVGRSAPRVVATVQPCRVRGDRAALARVVRNLVDNAVRHATDMVELDCRDVGRHARLIVADDGPGIPEADRERIFRRFVRLDEHRTRNAGGSGLGLAIVAEVVRSHGGTVEVADRPGGGVVFTVELPLDQESTSR
ncbi:sensor histidine kinase [Skermania piniformis]|uniref:histidine kinase n=1 Tax=Skermania pinensis TaxID=39122 RepID=A0ABX8S5Q6_9ACTN|nr:HAMP domain-containing sensor histidine kinase [Skermania piniformis]QXQ12319.1 HAMP domain-containing histidine kinase [Skermania piniformis]